MAGIRRIRPGGLSTDPSALDQPEALRIAQNVMLHRAGTAQPRPGFGLTSGIEPRTSDYRPSAIAPFGDELVVWSYDATAIPAAYRLERGGADAFYTGSYEPANEGVRGRPSFMVARGSLFVATKLGIRKLASYAGDAVRAGLPTSYAPAAVSYVSATSGDERAAVPSGAVVAYRYAFKREDANGYVIRSAPSSRYVARAPSGTYPAGMRVEHTNIYLPAEIEAGDIIELYRTTSTTPDTAEPGEDYYLALTYAITSADVAAGIVSSAGTDDVTDAQLGATLYTSQSQFGALASKEIPPIATDLVWWQGCAWAASYRERSSLPVWLTKVAYEKNTGTTVLEGVGVSFSDNGSGSFTSGSPTISSVSFSSGLGWDSLVAGQWISDPTGPTTSSAAIPIGAKVVSWDKVAQTITMDKNATASLVGQAFKFGDIVTLNVPGAIEFYAYSTESVAQRWFKCDISSTSLEDRAYNTALSLARAVACNAAADVGRTYAIKDGVSEGGSGEILFIATYPETTVPGDQTFSIQSTRGGAFVPNLTSAVSSIDTAAVARLAWSAQDEPEAWPPAQTTVVGDSSRAILALTPLQDALLVWKEDGLYRVTGSPPSSWVVDALATDARTPLRLLAPDCVCVLDGVAYAWTDRGVVAVGSDGVRGIVSAPIADTLRAYERIYYRGNTDPKRGAYMVAHPRYGLVILAVAATSSAESSSTWYVYHAATQRWSEWLRTDRCAAWDPSSLSGLVVAPDIDAWALLRERAGELTASNYRDATISPLSGVSISGGAYVVPVASFGGFVPAAGDVLADTRDGVFGPTTSYARVTSVSSDGTDYTLTVASAGGSPGGVTWHQAIPCTLMWQAQTMPGMSTRWSEMHADLLDTSSAYVSSWPMAIGGATDRDSSAWPIETTIDSTVTYSRPVRVGPPRAIVRAAQLYPQITIACAGVRWRLADVVLHGTPTSRRVRR